MTDLLIRDVDVVDGTGAPRYRADVSVDNGRIAEISGPRTISAPTDHRTGTRVRARAGIH